MGQARLMSIYQKFFAEYNQKVGQVLMTKETMIDNVSRKNAQNTINELMAMGVIPIVNENDTVLHLRDPVLAITTPCRPLYRP